MIPTQYVVLGLSGAGKDTIARLLVNWLPTKVYNIKWSSLMKNTFADWYGVDYEQFNDQQRRLEKVDGENFTYLDVMVRAYHAWDSIDPKLTIRPIVRKAREILKSGGSVVYTDTRKPAEAEAIAKLAQDYPTNVIYVYGRVGETRRSSDEHLEAILDYFKFFTDAAVCEYKNTGNEKDLVDFISLKYLTVNQAAA